MPTAGRYHTIGKAPMPGQPNNMAVGQPFDIALGLLLSGRKIARRGWNGQGMYCFYVPSREVIVEPSSEETRALVPLLGEGALVKIAHDVYMRWANGYFGRWTPTIEDILADDWSPLQ